MIDNLTLILQEFEAHKGEFVITDSHDVQRLVAIGDDGQDYYYVMYNGRKFTWYSCVGRFIPLKGKIDDKHYNEFVRLAKLNHHDQADFWGYGDAELSTQEHKAALMAPVKDHKFLTIVCWDLN